MRNCISVIIPMYDAVEYIQECIESVLNQTLNYCWILNFINIY